MNNYLEKYIEDIDYLNLNEWCYDNIDEFSNNKKNLFDYQVNALKNAIKVLNMYYTENEDKRKKTIYNNCLLSGMPKSSYDIKKYLTAKDKINNKVNNRFDTYSQLYEINKNNENLEEYIPGFNFFNRMCFWMATGSGKTIVIIKLIEILDYLKQNNLIPKKDILLLLPREDLIEQLKKEIKDYNIGKDKQIELINLLDYEEDKIKLSIFNNIKVYYYRSDLIRNERKEKILNYKDYYNNGNWYVILDEAHRGEKENSVIQDVVTFMSKNGFLFNFSATFTEAIDYTTTCFNFNLEKFISSGYGKNIYLSPSCFSFANNKDEFSEKDKKIQVLKAIIVYTLIKVSRKNNNYHNPLMTTLVNSVNTENSDLLIFFKVVEQIAFNENLELFEEAKKILYNDFQEQKSYILGNEEINFNFNSLENLNIIDIRRTFFNSNTPGKIEIIRGEKGKELILRLQTSSKPFGLIKIGAADVFEKEKLGKNYIISDSYNNDSVFSKINNDENINLLIGSRSFYEGWDSNRPNIINFINIGGNSAKKFVLQSIGRGIRIEPIKGLRKRLKRGNPEKNELLETLFIFATDKSAVKTIVSTISEQQSDEILLKPLEKNKLKFELLIPSYIKAKEKYVISKFNLSKNSLENLKIYFSNLSFSVCLIKYGLTISNYKKLQNYILNDNSIFQIKNDLEYKNMELLLQKIINHISLNEDYISDVKELNDEIIHFKHLKITNLKKEDLNNLIQKINAVASFTEIDEEILLQDYSNKKISRELFLQKMSSKPIEEFDSLKIVKLSEFYYLPMIYSKNENIEYIKHIIKVQSEVDFINNLMECIEKEQLNHKSWMFSKIDESMDRIYIPYFSKIDNKYKNFVPDFIFWIKENNNSYRIVFVDPKGTSYTDYENKIDGYEKLFLDSDEKPKVFKYDNMNITVELKMVTDDINKISEKYSKYWISNENFEWLK